MNFESDSISRTPYVDTSPEVADEIKYTTCYMCACRCGIKVHLQDGSIRYIQGNRDHPVNKGVLCAKGSAGIMTQNSPAKLTKPLKRVGPRGSGEFEEMWAACYWDVIKNINLEKKVFRISNPTLPDEIPYSCSALWHQPKN